MTGGMTRIVARAGMLVIVGVMMVAGVIGYAYLKPTAAATGPVEAIPIEAATSGGAGAPTIFEIDPATSEARYVIDEVLRGSPVTVVGKTDQVAGQLALDLTDLDGARLGAIQINARTLATDEGQRDRAVQNRILLTDQFEYITFMPTALVGLPAELAAGETAAFQVVGDLTIRGVTRPATFDVTVMPLSTDRLAGSATTAIRYADWGVSIPAVPFVASVADEARLELEFEAVAKA